MKIRVTLVLDHDQDPDDYDVRGDIEGALTGLALTEDYHAVIDAVESVEVWAAA